MGMTLKELLTKGEGTLSAQEAKALAAQCRMDVDTLYTLLEERGIKVLNCVAPGVIETDMMAAFTAEDKAALAEETPVGRLGTPEEVAKLLVFLAGEDAGYITGQVFGVNGGLVI